MLGNSPSRPSSPLIPDIPSIILSTLSFCFCCGPSVLSNLLGKGHLRSSQARKLNKRLAPSKALLTKEVTDPRAPPKVEVKLDKIGVIVSLILPNTSFSKVPTNCSAAHRGTLTILPINSFKKLPIIFFNPSITLPNKQYMVSVTFFMASPVFGFNSSGIILLVNAFIFSSISPKR